MWLGRYELKRPLGAGGQGEVFEARFHGPGDLQRTVAVKVMQAGHTLVHEARLGGLLRHPNLVDVYEIGEQDGTWFMAMELCTGGSLAGRGPLPPRAVVDVGLAVAAALAYAHDELGLVHLDLKPQNLLLAGPVVKVADLGLARITDDARLHRRAGTVGYMAPEMLEHRPVDLRADIFSLGVVLAELATGRRPGAAHTVDLDTDEVGTAVVPGSVRWLEPVLERCLHADPEHRFSTMQELQAALAMLEPPGASLVQWLDLPSPEPTPRSPGSNIQATGEGLIGRQEALSQLERLLREPALVTLRGPGGIGKTCLAREAARAYRGRTDAQAWFVDLSASRSSLEVIAAVASVLGVALARGDEHELERRLVLALRSRHDALLVLDNFEQVVEHRTLVARLRAASEHTRFVVTSRQALGLVDEQVVDVDVLPQTDAVALLVQTAARRGVALDPGATEVADLARRLEGHPLALELAAGRLGVLSVSEVAERLSGSFLRSGSAHLSDREATLDGALEWSWSLLGAAEQSTLAQLSVFRSGFSLDAAQAVVSVIGPEVVSELIERLHDRSLLSRSDGRLRMLQVVRQFAALRLRDEGAELRHGAWFAALGTPDALRALRLHGGQQRRAALVADLDDLIAAVQRAVERGDAAVAAGAAVAAWQVFGQRGPYSRGIELLELARGLAPSSSDVLLWIGRALRLMGRYSEALDLLLPLLERTPRGRRSVEIQTALADLLLEQGRGSEALEYLREGLAWCQEVGDRYATGATLAVRARVMHRTYRFEEAARDYELALGMLREVGDQRTESGILGNLGLLYSELGRLDDAEQKLHSALASLRRAGDPGREAVVLGNLGLLARARGQHRQAVELCRLALELHREVGDQRGEARTQGNLALFHMEQGQLDLAEGLFRAALALQDELGDRFTASVVRSNLGGLCIEDGRLHEAEQHLAAALVVQRELTMRHFEGITLARLGEARLELGHPERAEVDLRAAGAIEEADPSQQCNILGALARILLQRGDTAEARTLVERALGLARELEDPRVLGRVAVVAVQLERGDGDLAAARRVLLEAEAPVRACGALPELCGLLCARAELAWQEGDRDAARVALAGAAEAAARLHAGPQSLLGRRLARVRACRAGASDDG